MSDNLNVIINLKKTIIYLDKIVVNFPGNERELKDKIREAMYDILEFLYLASDFKKQRKEYLIKAIVKIKMMDFYLKISADKKYISYKKYQKVSLHLLDELKQIYGWMRNEEKEQVI